MASADISTLDLATDTFEAPFKSQDPGGEISEDPLLDPVHDIIGSAAEDNNFEIVNVKNTTSPQFYEQSLSSTVTGTLDSTSEDCSTGILISPAEDDVPSGLEIANVGISALRWGDGDLYLRFTGLVDGA